MSADHAAAVNQRIVEILGWREVYRNPLASPPEERRWTQGAGDLVFELPDYTGDLDVIHAAVRALSPRQQQEFIPVLRNICAVEGNWPELATPEQMCRAFLAIHDKQEVK